MERVFSKLNINGQKYSTSSNDLPSPRLLLLKAVALNPFHWYVPVFLILSFIVTCFNDDLSL